MVKQWVLPAVDCLRDALHQAGVVHCEYDPQASPYMAAIYIDDRLRSARWETVQQFFLPAIDQLVKAVVEENFREAHTIRIRIQHRRLYRDYQITISVSRGLP